MKSIPADKIRAGQALRDAQRGEPTAITFHGKVRAEIVRAAFDR